MDNRKDRQFYWEVKDFFNKKPDVNIKPKTEPLVNAVKNILETSKPKPAPRVYSNPNMTSAVEKSINNAQQIRKAGTPEIAAFTKNISGNPFRSLTESVKKLYEQEEERFDPELLKSKARELGDTQTQINQMGDINTATPEQRKEYVRLRDQEAAAKVIRDRQLELQKQDEEETEEAEAQVAGSTIKTTETGARVGVKPDFVKDREAKAAAEEMGPPKSLAEPEDTTTDSARMNALRAGGQTPSTNTTPEPAKDGELEKRVAGRIKARDRKASLAKQEAKIQLARMQARGPSGQSRAAQANYAEAMARLELKSKGEDETQKGLSDEDIRGQEQRSLAIARRTPEEKAAAAAKDKAVVADLNRRADEIRQGKSGTGTQTSAKPAPNIGKPTLSGDTTTDSARMNALRAGGQTPSTGTTQTKSTQTTLQTQNTTSFGSQVNQKANSLSGTPQGEFESMASKPASLANFVSSSENDNLEPGFRELNRMTQQAGSINTIKPAEPVKQTKASSYRI